MLLLRRTARGTRRDRRSSGPRRLSPADDALPEVRARPRRSWPREPVSLGAVQQATKLPVAEDARHSPWPRRSSVKVEVYELRWACREADGRRPQIAAPGGSIACCRHHHTASDGSGSTRRERPGPSLRARREGGPECGALAAASRSRMRSRPASRPWSAGSPPSPLRTPPTGGLEDRAHTVSDATRGDRACVAVHGRHVAPGRGRTRRGRRSSR